VASTNAVSSKDFIMIYKGRIALGLLLLLVFVIGSSGCGTSKTNVPASVSGKVTYKGAPVTGGTVAFNTKDAGSYAAVIHSDGTYSSNQVPEGEFIVTIETESINPNMKKQVYGGKAKGATSPVPEKQAEKKDAGLYVPIPPRYADKTKSGLTATLKSGNQTHNFELTD
jgi:hypothetical protein